MDFGTTMYNFANFGAADDIDDIDTNSPRKILNVYRNGNPAAVIRYKLKESLSLQEHVNYLKHKFKFKETDKLRIFNTEGLEIYPEDFKYLKDDSSIFISKGEGFNKSSTLCEYVIMRKLGEGSFGEVNLACHKQTKQLYAIKFLKKPKQSDAAGLDRFFVEAETMKNLSHKNIVKIINCFTMKDMQIALVMEYLEGGTLLDYVKQRKRLTEEEARHFFRQMVEAVSYCHSNKVIHCDLKLENILLESENSKTVKIIDFGISGLKTHFKAKIGGGSLHHMTPEFLSGKRKDLYSGIDVWALGCILFEMVCGKWAFYGEDGKKIKAAICKGKFSFGSLKTTLSTEIKDLITKMLDMDPFKRITMVDIINHPWMNQPAQKTKEVPRQIVRLNTNVLEQMEKHKDVDDELNKKKYKDLRHLDQYLDEDDL